VEALLNIDLWIALFTLAALEIVLGIDNIIFLSIMANKLPLHQRAKARTIGLAAACLMRIGLLLSLAWLASLTADLFTVLGMGISGRDLVLGLGGAFLIWKSAGEIRESLAHASAVKEELDEGKDGIVAAATISFFSVIVQIMVIDIVFSLDSVITAIGMTNNIPVMVAAIMLAVAVMMFFAGPVGAFVERNPSIKILALAFLVLIGVFLVGESLDYHIEKAYIYFAMGFSLVVELINMRLRRLLARA
jgi:predicted tellurium resistance membrane protein TerC